MSDPVADISIRLTREANGRFSVSLQFAPPGSPTERETERESVHIDLARLTAQPDDVNYGVELLNQLLPLTTQKSLANALKECGEARWTVHVRLIIDSSAHELQSISWERLADPLGTPFLIQRANTYFTRYSLKNSAGRRLMPQRRLRVLLAVANPSNLHEMRLPPIDFPADGWRKTFFRDLLVELSSPLTLARLSTELTNQYDVLCLACHGRINVRGETEFILADNDNRVAREDAASLVRALANLEDKQPSLVILLSCDSAGDAEMASTGLLATELCSNGVPSVIGIQGKMSIESGIAFLDELFLGIRRFGSVERAVADGRAVIKNSGEWWRPALFSRLRFGQLPSNGKFSSDRDEDDEIWNSIVAAVRRGKCTPVLGPELIEHLVGNKKDLALRWAKDLGFSWSPSDRESLPQVAQYRAYRSTRETAISELEEFLRQDLIHRYSDIFSDHREVGPWRGPRLDELVQVAGKYEMEANGERDPHGILARCPFSLYVTANPGDIMETALITRERKPRVIAYPWQPRSLYAADNPLYALTLPPDERWIPSEEQPAVFHLFGHLRYPSTVVLTENDYFDFLLSFDRGPGSLPAFVKTALNQTTVLFLGFSPQDWGFRAFFRGLQILEGSSLRNNYPHVAVQISPSDQDKAGRRYLESYFSDFGKSVQIYYGSAIDFMQELSDRLESQTSGRTR